MPFLIFVGIILVGLPLMEFVGPDHLIFLAIGAAIPVLALIVAAVIYSLMEAREQKHPPQQPAPQEEHGDNLQREPYPLTFSLTPGVETFTPAPLPDGQRFLITLTGAYTCEAWYTDGGFASGRIATTADGCYDTQSSPNFTHCHSGPLFDLRPVDGLLEEDRSHHRYSFAYTGTGKKLSILLNLLPQTHGRDWHKEVKGGLTVTLRPLQPEDRALVAAEEERLTRKRTAAIQPRIQELTHLAEAQPHYANPKHLEDYARKNKDTLLRGRDEITKKYLAEREVIAYLKEHAPQLVPFAAWEMRALAVAEQMDVQEPPAPPPPPPRRKLTEEEVRTLIVHREDIKADDKIALATAKAKAILRARAALDQFENLDPEQRQQLEQELIEQILMEEDHTNGPGKQI